MNSTRYFLDTSALLKLYVEEPGSSMMRRTAELAQPGTIAISRLATVELTSALVRKTRAGDFSEEGLATALGFFDEDVASFFAVTEINDAIIQRAIGLARKHGLRGADTIQLASALLVQAETAANEDFTLFSSDRELNTTAQREQLAVVDPSMS